MFRNIKKRKKHSLYARLVKTFGTTIFIFMVCMALSSIYIGNVVRTELGQIDEIESTVIKGEIENLKIEGVIDKVRIAMSLTILAYICISIVLMIITAKHIIKPIGNISDATKEVSAGNFDVVLESERKDEIGDLINNFNKMTKELQNIEMLRKDFTTNVSHEFKTPIASIQGFTKLLKDNNLSEKERQEYIDIIIEETDRLINLSSNILKISKLENQEIIINKKEYSLDEQIRKSILLLEYDWSAKNIEFQLDLKPIKYYGDEELLYQVWINLIGNAIKFSDNSGKVKIKMYKENDEITVEIKDYGMGIDKQDQKRIFEKFYQADSSRSKTGNGLGLAIVKRIIELSGGSISFESKISKGTTFKITL